MIVITIILIIMIIIITIISYNHKGDRHTKDNVNFNLFGNRTPWRI